MYYNTTNEQGDFLAQNKIDVGDQDKLVYDVFRRKGGYLSSHDVEDILDKAGMKTVRSSVVRAINTLTKAGLLEKTGVKKIGKYGKPVYLWKMT